MISYLLYSRTTNDDIIVVSCDEWNNDSDVSEKKNIPQSIS